MTKVMLAALMAGAAWTGMGTAASAQVDTGQGAPVEDAAPIPPGHAAPTFSLPPRDGQGAWTTPNRDLGADEATWHLRVALNVAALGCPGATGGRMIAAYNAMLTSRGGELAAAASATETGYRVRFGAAWQQHHDDDMTRLYNFFAQPPAQEAFCAEADAVLREAAAVEPAQFARWSMESLRRLDAPFTTFYAAFDRYRVALARYRDRHPPAAMPVVVVAAADYVVPVGPPRPAATFAIAAIPAREGPSVTFATFVRPRTIGPEE